MSPSLSRHVFVHQGKKGKDKTACILVRHCTSKSRLLAAAHFCTWWLSNGESLADRTDSREVEKVRKKTMMRCAGSRDTSNLELQSGKLARSGMRQWMLHVLPGPTQRLAPEPNWNGSAGVSHGPWQRHKRPEMEWQRWPQQPRRRLGGGMH